MSQGGGEDLVQILHKLCKKVWQEGKIPEAWEKLIPISLLKKSDKTECSNHRIISLISHIGKKLLIVLLNRLNYYLEL